MKCKIFLRSSWWFDWFHLSKKVKVHKAPSNVNPALLTTWTIVNFFATKAFHSGYKPKQHSKPRPCHPGPCWIIVIVRNVSTSATPTALRRHVTIVIQLRFRIVNKFRAIQVKSTKQMQIDSDTVAIHSWLSPFILSLLIKNNSKYLPR